MLKSIRPFALFILLATGFWLLASPPASAQNPPPTTAPARPQGFDPAAIRTNIFARFKTALESNDDEWKLLEPKISKIFLLQLDLTILPNMGGRGGRGFNFRSMIRGMIDPNALPSQVEEKTTELQTIVDSNETSTSAYTNALAQLRKARERARDELTTAQKDLTSLLTMRQEATLVQMGLLE